MKNTYFLSYEIEIDADTREDAVQQALAHVRDRKIAATWDVADEGDDDSGGGTYTVLPGGAVVGRDWNDKDSND